MERSRPKPTRLQWFVGGLVIAVCAMAVGNLLGVATYANDGCGLTTFAILVPFPVLLGFWQYLALARTWRRCAELAGGFCLAFGAMGCLLFTVLFSIALADQIDGRWFRDWMPLLVASGVLLCASYLNFRWYIKLRDFHAHVSIRPRLRVSLLDCFAAVTAFGLLLGSWQYYRRCALPFANHVSVWQSPIRLPYDATDVSYNASDFGFMYAEFTCSEMAFRQWIDREQSFRARQSDILLNETATTMQRHLRLPDRSRVPDVVIVNALEFYFTELDHTIKAVYDRDTKRAYYYSSTR